MWLWTGLNMLSAEDTKPIVLQPRSEQLMKQAVCGEREFGQRPISKQESYVEVFPGNLLSHFK
jgi:hypothetical protein